MMDRWRLMFKIYDIFWLIVYGERALFLECLQKGVLMERTMIDWIKNKFWTIMKIVIGWQKNNLSP